MLYFSVSVSFKISQAVYLLFLLVEKLPKNKKYETAFFIYRPAGF
jgi:hypothetical protein